jgi:hypothetical protein
MDERYDMVRTIRDENYRYILNFMPHRIYGQHIRFLWRAPSMQSWERAFLLGEANRIQSRFFTPKVMDELYNIREDPHCIRNLALDPVYAEAIEVYREKILDQMIKTYDTGIIPEAMLMRLRENSDPYTYMNSLGNDYAGILESAILAIEGTRDNLPGLEDLLRNKHPAVRYWGATGCVILREGAMELKEALNDMLMDEYATNQIAAAEALYELGETALALNSMRDILGKQLKNLLDREETKEGFAPEVFILTHALNVISFFDDRGISLQKEIQAIAEKENPDYAKRAAEYLMNIPDL